MIANHSAIAKKSRWQNDAFHVRGPAISPTKGASILIVMIAVVVVSGAVAWDGDVPGWELSILEFFNGWPDWLEPIMWVLQQPGVLLAPLVAGAIIAGLSRRWHYMIPFALLPIYKLLIEKRVVKVLVDRLRPYSSVGPEINARGSSDLDGPSFPSGHTTTAVATGLLISLFVPPKWKPLPIVWGFFVGIARLYYGEHNALDVVAGCAVAAFFVTAVQMLIINRWVNDGPPSAPTS